ncbi:suppressor of glycerol defect [Apophysomyces sp. BC1034]|nr:suppressor of glycerol defect [Apophysomyces sp. BC1034]
MRPQPTHKRGSFKNHNGGRSRNENRDSQPAKQISLPESIKEELDEQENDDRTFQSHYVNRAANRKERRKQKRLDKGKRKAAHHLQKRQPVEPPAKRQKKTESAATETLKKNEQKKLEAPKKAVPEQKKKKSTEDSVKKLAKSNPHLYSLLESDNLVGDSSKAEFEQDDKEIAYWEKKLGVSKKKGLGKSFEEDGLMELLGGLGGSEDEVDDDETYLREKRRKAKAAQRTEKLNNEAEEAMDELFAGLDSSDDGEEEEDAEGDSEVDDDDEELDYEDMRGSDMDDSEMEEENEQNSQEEEESEEEEDENVVEDNDSLNSGADDQTNEVKELPKKDVTKYIPPHLRKSPTTKTEQQLRLQRLLQGLFNKLSESNMESILLDIEKCYGNYARHDVTSTITEIVLSSIAQKSNLLDSFVIIYATVVGSLYRLIGIEFAAHFVQTLVESFEKNYDECRKSIATGVDQGEEGPAGAKESKNLLTLTLELYNFQVISCVLVYDLVRMLIGDLDEQSVELLLKIVKTSGAQLRADDPAALKDIIDEIQKETAKRDPSSISTRHKFMLETIADVKNNKIKSGPTMNRQSDKEMVLKMKKYLNGLGKKRAVRSTEPLRVSLEDIHQIETKGKWWLVGASWKDNLVGTESKYAANKVPEDLKKDQSMQETLLKLARKQGMNTDIRRSIFVTIMGAEDYVDAFESLMKLSLSEVQQREISRVLLQCTGNEKTFNPYYMLVSKRLCEYNHSFKVTYQYCLWDFLRDLGEADVGGLDRSTEATRVGNSGIRLSRIVNMAKFYAYLIAQESLSLSVLKSVNFMTLTDKGRIFLEIMFANIFLQSKEGGPQAVANVFGKVSTLPTLSQGCVFFLHESVITGKHSSLSEAEMETVRWGCKIAREVLSDRVAGRVAHQFQLMQLLDSVTVPDIPKLICSTSDNGTIPGTALANCSALAEDITYCQNLGKAITISLGGSTLGAGFKSSAEATQFAITLWDLFLGGSSATRPFGEAILDGVDLDIENGGSDFYDDFLTELKSKYKGATRKYYLTAAPQCVYPDAMLGGPLNSTGFDAVYVQFYNNPCGVQTYVPGSATAWNFGLWDYWAQNYSPNKDVKVYIGAPASNTAAGSGYISPDKLGQLAADMRKSYPSFGGVMLWDASQASANNQFDVSIKNALENGGSCNKPFNYPPCDAPAWKKDASYKGGDRVSFEYIWEAKWDATNVTIEGWKDETWTIRK